MPTSILGTEIRRDRANKTSKLTQSLFVRTLRLAQRLNIPSTAPDTTFPTGTSLPEYDPNLPAGDTSELRSLIGQACKSGPQFPTPGRVARPRRPCVVPWPLGPCRPLRAPTGSGGGGERPEWTWPGPGGRAPRCQWQ
jgi:hypothetical protein